MKIMREQKPTQFSFCITNVLEESTFRVKKYKEKIQIMKIVNDHVMALSISPKSITI